MHLEPHPMARKVVHLKDGTEYRLEDWWDRLGEGSWMHCIENMACIQYAMRGLRCDLPVDDEVVYGKVGSFGYLIHVSEIDNEKT